MGVWINGTSCAEWGTTTIQLSSASDSSFTFKTDVISGIRVEFSDYTTVRSSLYGSSDTCHDYNTESTDTLSISSSLAGKTLNIWSIGLWSQPYVVVNFTAPPSLTINTFTAAQQNDGTVKFTSKATGSYGSGNISYTIKTGSTTLHSFTGSSGSSIAKTTNIASSLKYGTSYTFTLTATYSGVTKTKSVSKKFTAPSISPPSSLKSSASIGPSTTLTWSAAKLSNTTGTITYTVLKNGASIGTTTSTSYTIQESVASTWGSSPVTLTVKASGTGLSNTYSGSTLNSAESSEVSFTYAAFTVCKKPDDLRLEKNLSYNSLIDLIWSGEEPGVQNDIVGYHIQYQDCADGTSWPETWIDLETDWLASPLGVLPPDKTGRYRRFRIQVKGSAGSKYYSDWLISSNSLRKDVAPFEGFTDPSLVQFGTKIKASHMTEMQNRINDLLLFDGKEAVSFTKIIAGQTKLSGWTAHVTEIRHGIETLGRAPDTWIKITENRPRVDVMNQLRDKVAGYSMVTISVSGEDGDISGCIVTIRNTEDNSIIEQFEYAEPAVIKILPGVSWKVECSNLENYIVTPSYGPHTAEACIDVSVELYYRNARRYGYRREKNNPDPSARITYLYDAEGMTPMHVDLTTGEPDYGSWKSFIDEICRPVMLKYDGTVDYELDHDDQTKKLDGTASDIANTAYRGNAMVEFRNYIWVRRLEDDDYEEVVFSDVQYDDTYHAYANINENWNVNSSFYWGMYEGCNVDGIMRSIASKAPTASQTAASEIAQAEANGSGWYLIYKSGWDFIIDLLTLLSKSDNSQSAFGYGMCDSGNSSPVNTGTLVSKPAFCGYSNGKTEVKALYIEGLWGNLWERLAGLILDKSNGLYVKMVPPYSTTIGSGYVLATTITGTSGNFVSASYCKDGWGYLPKTLNGSESTYMCDKVWYNTSNTAYALIGGRWTLGTGCGSRSMNFSETAATVANYTGARLSYLAP